MPGEPQPKPFPKSFERIPEGDPKDPSDKMKVLQSIQIESGQLITVLKSDDKDDQA